MENEAITDESSQDWTKKEVSRRRLLALAMGGAAATAMALAGSTKIVRAADGDPLIIGENNYGTNSITFLQGSSLVSEIEFDGAALIGNCFNPNPDGFSEGVFGQASTTSGTGVQGIAFATSGKTKGVRGQSLSPDGVGVSGSGGAIGVEGVATAEPSTGTATGVSGISKSDVGIGVSGLASAQSGSARGVVGESLAPDGRGVQGLASAISGANKGVQGVSGSSSGIGVEGLASAPSGVTKGVFGASSSDSGIGVEGHADAASGLTRGVVGTCDSTQGIGVRGLALATTGFNVGVSGSSASTTGVGVEGRVDAASGPTTGVSGRVVSPDGIAVEATGHPSGVGLRVGGGRSQFSTIVEGTIPAGAMSVTVADARANAKSEVMVVLTGDPGLLTIAGRGPLAGVKNGVSFVSVTTGSFTVNLMSAASTQVPFRAFIVEKA